MEEEKYIQMASIRFHLQPVCYMDAEFENFFKFGSIHKICGEDDLFVYVWAELPDGFKCKYYLPKEDGFREWVWYNYNKET